MKIKFTLIIIIFIFINGCFGKKVSSNELQERNGLYYLVNKSKPFSGVIINRYPNGFVSSKIKIKNGKKEGKYTEYFTTSLFVLGGGPSLTKEYKNGVLNGDVIKYNSLLFKDAIISRKKYQNGVAEGKWISYFGKGKDITKVGFFTDGLPNGEFDFYFHPNKITSKLNFINGLLNGPVTYFYENGQKKITIDFVNGIMNGKIQIYSKNGVLIYNLPVKDSTISAEYSGDFYNEKENVEFVIDNAYIDFTDHTNSNEGLKIEFIDLLLLNKNKPLNEENAENFWNESTLY